MCKGGRQEAWVRLHRERWKRNASAEPESQVCVDFHTCVSFAGIPPTQSPPHSLHRSSGRIGLQPLSEVEGTKETLPY